jgi:DNA-binding beta-propeller fold protein YncE
LRALFLLPLLLASASADPTPYHFLKEIPIGGEGGWDYLSCDATAHRLYVTHGTKVVVIDTEMDAIVGEVADTAGVHGFTLAPDLGLGFSSNGKENKASVVDLKTLKTLAKVETGGDPDAILYAFGEYEVYTFNGHGQTSTVFSAKSNKVVATIPLPGDPEFAAYDSSEELVYDNIEDKNEVVVIDANSHKVVHTWPLTGGGKPTGMAIDPAHHRLFIGCRDPQVMLMVDANDGKVLASLPIHSGVDATAFDSGTQLAFASTKEGIVTIAHEDGDKLTLVQELTTAPGARTMALDVATHKIYLATAQFEPLPSNAPAGTRPKPIDGTFKILVYGM